MYNNITLFQIETIKSYSIPICFIENNNITKIIGKHHNDYKIITVPFINIININEPCFLLYFTQNNVAHSICQFIRSLFEYVKLEIKYTIFISENISKMPFLDNLFKLLFGSISYKILLHNTKYTFSNIYIPEYIWFTNDISYNLTFDSANNIRIYNTNISLSSDYGLLFEPLIYFNNCINEIYNNNYQNYQVYDNIVIIKSNLCTDSTTPGRQIYLNNNTIKLIKNKNYKMILPHQINNIIEHIVLLRSAKNIITSYGGANCINRFFFNPDANIKVICNLSYKSEYKVEWHNRVSCYLATKYIFFLDINNKISINELQKILKY